MTTIEELLASPEPFRQWLDGFADDANVAVTCDAAACPLAHFIRDRTGQQVRVMYTGIYLNDFDPVNDFGLVVDLPAWVSGFVKTVDFDYSPHDTYNDPIETPITAGQCRAALVHVAEL